MGCDLRPTLSLSFFLSNSPAFLLRYNGDDSHGFNGVHGVFCTYQVGAFLMSVVEGSLDLGWMSWVSCGSQGCCSHRFGANPRYVAKRMPERRRSAVVELLPSLNWLSLGR